MRLLLIGPPGCGKGTQGACIAEMYGVAHIAAGDILRAEVADGTVLGRRVAAYLKAGELVPDDIILDMVMPRVQAAAESTGYVLDGFPRSIGQAIEARRIAEENDFALRIAVYLTSPTDVLVRRLLKRAEIEGRSDDTADVIEHRLTVFAEATQPLLALYRERGLLHEIDATLPPAEVTAAIRDVLPALVRAGVTPDGT